MAHIFFQSSEGGGVSQNLSNTKRDYIRLYNAYRGINNKYVGGTQIWANLGGGQREALRFIC